MLNIIGGGRAGGGAVVKATRNGDGSITLVGTGSQFAYKLAGDAVVLVTGHGASTYDIPASSWTDEVEGAGNLPATLPAGSAPTVPDAITDLAATHGNAQVVLTWTPPDDGGSALTGYTVERSLDGSTGWTEIATPGAAATGYTDTGRTNGVEYFYRAKAINGEGAAATWSNVDSATPATVPAQVTTLAAIAGDTEIDLSWTAPNNGGSALTGYTLQRRVGAGSFANYASPAAGATSFVDTGLTNGVLHSYRIVAENAEGAALLWSNEASGTPAGVPAGPEATYLELDVVPDGSAGWTPANVTKTSLDVTNTTSRNHVAWDLSGFTAFADGAKIVFNAFQPVASANVHYLRLSADNTLSTDNLGLWSGAISNTIGNHTTIEATLSAADISGRDFLGFINTLTSGDLQIRNFTMGGNATAALDMTADESKNVGFTKSGASATGLTLSGATARNSITWPLPHFLGYEVDETITFNVASSGRVIVRVGRGDDLNTTGGDTYDVIYDNTPGLTPVPVTITITQSMLDNHRRFFGIVSVETSDIVITEFTTSTSAPAPSGDYDVTYTGALSGISAVVTPEGEDWRITVTDTGAGTYDGATAVFTTAQMDSKLPLKIVGPADASTGGNKLATPGLYIASSPVYMTMKWKRDGEVFLTETNAYTITSPEDDGATITYEETAGTLYGSIAPESLEMQTGYVETKVVFNGATSQRHFIANILTGIPTTSNITEALLFASYDTADIAAGGDFANGTGLRLYTNGSATAAAITMGSATHTFLSINGRIHLLASLSGGTLKSRIMRADGTPYTKTPVASTGGIFNHTTGSTAFGSNTALSTFITGKLAQLSIWDLRSASVPDIDLQATQDLFWNPSTFVMNAPAIAQATLGDKASDRLIVGIWGDADLPNFGADFLNTPANYGRYADFSCNLTGTFSAELS